MTGEEVISSSWCAYRENGVTRTPTTSRRRSLVSCYPHWSRRARVTSDRPMESPLVPSTRLGLAAVPRTPYTQTTSAATSVRCRAIVFACRVLPHARVTRPLPMRKSIKLTSGQSATTRASETAGTG